MVCSVSLLGAMQDTVSSGQAEDELGPWKRRGPFPPEVYHCHNRISEFYFPHGQCKCQTSVNNLEEGTQSPHQPSVKPQVKQISARAYPQSSRGCLQQLRLAQKNHIAGR